MGADGFRPGCCGSGRVVLDPAPGTLFNASAWSRRLSACGVIVTMRGYGADCTSSVTLCRAGCVNGRQLARACLLSCLCVVLVLMGVEGTVLHRWDGSPTKNSLESTCSSVVSGPEFFMRAMKGAIACLLCQSLYKRSPGCALWILQGLRPGHSTPPTHSLTFHVCSVGYFPLPLTRGCAMHLATGGTLSSAIAHTPVPTQTRVCHCVCHTLHNERTSAKCLASAGQTYSTHRTLDTSLGRTKKHSHFVHGRRTPLAMSKAICDSTCQCATQDAVPGWAGWPQVTYTHTQPVPEAAAGGCTLCAPARTQRASCILVCCIAADGGRPEPCAWHLLHVGLLGVGSWPVGPPAGTCRLHVGHVLLSCLCVVLVLMGVQGMVLHRCEGSPAKTGLKTTCSRRPEFVCAYERRSCPPPPTGCKTPEAKKHCHFPAPQAHPPFHTNPFRPYKYRCATQGGRVDNRRWGRHSCASPALHNTHLPTSAADPSPAAHCLVGPAGPRYRSSPPCRRHRHRLAGCPRPATGAARRAHAGPAAARAFTNLVTDLSPCSRALYTARASGQLLLLRCAAPCRHQSPAASAPPVSPACRTLRQGRQGSVCAARWTSP